MVIAMKKGCHKSEVARVISVLGARGFQTRIVSPGPQVVLTVSHAAFERQDTLDIYGAEGSIHVPLLNEGELILKSSTSEFIEEHPPHPNLHQPLIDDFTRAVLDDRPPTLDARLARQVNQILTHIYSDEQFI